MLNLILLQAEGAAQQGSQWSFWIMMILIFVVFYFFMPARFSCSSFCFFVCGRIIKK